ncbi:helix-turn-helix domain-containing protein [Acidisphaera sp. S103]|uniref:helix-turn-helix domain-containing protein n=1 Tax=Acidisphaera sp. S103 TaxID=1747223 RepID=UPI00131B49F2|nr:helix-turn-helix domain-containing protein [Acidisphaera sp. S103]
MLATIPEPSIHNGLRPVAKMDTAVPEEMTTVSRLADESVTTVALDLDYGSPATFTAMFKRILGAAPSHYLSPIGVG